MLYYNLTVTSFQRQPIGGSGGWWYTFVIKLCSHSYEHMHTIPNTFWLFKSSISIAMYYILQTTWQPDMNMQWRHTRYSQMVFCIAAVRRSLAHCLRHSDVIKYVIGAVVLGFCGVNVYRSVNQRNFTSSHEYFRQVGRHMLLPPFPSGIGK